MPQLFPSSQIFTQICVVFYAKWRNTTVKSTNFRKKAKKVI